MGATSALRLEWVACVNPFAHLDGYSVAVVNTRAAVACSHPSDLPRFPGRDSAM